MYQPLSKHYVIDPQNSPCEYGCYLLYKWKKWVSKGWLAFRQLGKEGVGNLSSVLLTPKTMPGDVCQAHHPAFSGTKADVTTWSHFFLSEPGGAQESLSV